MELEVNKILKTYSTIIVIDSLLKSDEIDSTIDKIERNIKNNGGEIVSIDRWGKKRLAYEIKKRQYGYYVELIFKAGGDIVKIIEREYSLDENLLRYLTIQLDRKTLQYYEELKQKSGDRKKARQPDSNAKKSTAVVPDPVVQNENSVTVNEKEQDNISN